MVLRFRPAAGSFVHSGSVSVNSLLSSQPYFLPISVGQNRLWLRFKRPRNPTKSVFGWTKKVEIQGHFVEWSFNRSVYEQTRFKRHPYDQARTYDNNKDRRKDAFWLKMFEVVGQGAKEGYTPLPKGNSCLSWGCLKRCSKFMFPSPFLSEKESIIIVYIIHSISNTKDQRGGREVGALSETPVDKKPKIKAYTTAKLKPCTVVDVCFYLIPI